MALEDRINAFARLGERIANLPEEERSELFTNAYHHNQWFTEENLRTAFSSLAENLSEAQLKKWMGAYKVDPVKPKKVGIIMAGNVPMVGLHDLMVVLLAGHHAYIKLSSQDEVIMRWLMKELCEIEPEFQSSIHQPEFLKNIDVAIATGSDNTARYFDYYFRNIPHIIRKNRTGVAVLDGTESKEELEQLGKDIFLYFGLGCRNVSKLYVPEGYDFTPLFQALETYESVIHHHKYRNNYDYHKSILLVNRDAHLDTGFLLATENEALVSPLSIIYYEHYEGEGSLDAIIEEQEEKIQVVVGHKEGRTPFGQAQFPKVWEYADQVDTMRFLLSLN